MNLGVGMPTLCSNYVDPHKSLVFHSENGAILGRYLFLVSVVPKHITAPYIAVGSEAA